LNKQASMSNMKGTIRSCATTDGRPSSESFCDTATLLVCSLFVALVMALTGCTTPTRQPESAPPVQISESTWQQVDNDIRDASIAATESAWDQTRVALDNWIGLVQKRTEADFIPWFGSYWTQQWLTIKMAWYKLGAEEETDPTVKRLAAYLQEQYHERVLTPVSMVVSPDVIREQATEYYVQTLSQQLKEISRRYGVPPDQFDRRLKYIPAIALTTHPAISASLYQIVHADPITKLPAYEALIDQIRSGAGGAEGGPSEVSISPVAQQASEKLATRLITGGGASAAAAVVGGIPGVIISLGAASVGAMEHENERPKLEALLRESLKPVLDDMWLELMEDPARGVMAGVYSISRQIERSLDKTVTQPVEFEPVPRGIPLSDEQRLQDKNNDDEAPADDEHAAE
jgi:hypothetical protein